MIDPRKIFLAILKATWPAPNTTPQYGTMKGSSLANPSANLDVLADAVEVAVLSAAALSGDTIIPINTLDIVITGKGTETVIGKFEQ